MKMRRLGRSNLEVSPLAFGGNVFGWTVDEATSFSLLDFNQRHAQTGCSRCATRVARSCTATSMNW